MLVMQQMHMGRIARRLKCQVNLMMMTVQNDDNDSVSEDNNDDDDDDDDDDGVYLKAVSCEFLNLQIIQIICKCEVMML